MDGRAVSPSRKEDGMRTWRFWLVFALSLTLLLGLAAACKEEEKKSETPGPPGKTPVTSSVFVVPVTLTPGPGFAVVEDNAPRDFALERRGSDARPDAYLSFLSPDYVYDPDIPIAEFNPGITKEPAPDDLMSWIEGNPGVEVVEEASDVTVGGEPGRQIDVRGGSDGVALFSMGPTQFVLFPGEPARFVVLDINGLMVVVAGGPLGDAAFESVVADIEAMLATVRFES